MTDFKNMTNEQKRDIALNGTDDEAYALYCFMTWRIAKGTSPGPVKTFEQWMKG